MTDEELETSLAEVDRQLAVYKLLEETKKLRDALAVANRTLKDANWAVTSRREALVHLLKRIQLIKDGKGDEDPAMFG